jgi:hypothetical protein
MSSEQVQEIKDLQVQFFRRVLGENLVFTFDAPQEVADYISQNLKVTHNIDYFAVTPLDLELIARAVCAELVQKAQAAVILGYMKENSDGIDFGAIFKEDGTRDEVLLSQIVIKDLDIVLDQEAFDVLKEVKESTNPEVVDLLQQIKDLNPQMYGDDAVFSAANKFAASVEALLANT